MAVYKTVLLFSDVELLAAGLELQGATSTVKCPIYLLDDHWPLNREKNLIALESIKRRWPEMTVITSPQNLGIHHGFNHLTSQMPLEDGDIIITTAPDTVPLRAGWDDAMVRVLNADPKLAYVGAYSYAIRETAGVIWKRAVHDGIQLDIATNRPAMLHGAGWRWSFLKTIGGFHEPTAYYGHLESYLWSRMLQMGMHTGYLPDYEEDFRLEPYHPQVYRNWKLAHAHTYSFKGSFAEYLAAGSPAP